MILDFHEEVLRRSRDTVDSDDPVWLRGQRMRHRGG